MPIQAAFIVPHPPIILPEIGSGQELKLKHTTDALTTIAEQIARIRPDTIILTSPHSISYSDYFHISPDEEAFGDFKQFGAEQVQFHEKYDTDFIHRLTHVCEEENFSAGTLGASMPALDHGTMVPLYFIRRQYSNYKLVRIGLSGLSMPEHYKFGQLIRRTADQTNKNIVFLASGDLSHRVSSESPYGYVKEGAEFDAMVTKAMDTANFMDFLRFDNAFTERAAECGLRSFVIMAGALEGMDVCSKLLSYECPFGIGYGTASFLPKESSGKIAEDEYVQLARLSLETYVTKGEYAKMPEPLSHLMTEARAGVFVSIKKHGQLRGCIGTISPVNESIAMEILENAVSSGTRDPRFPPVTADELPFLSYSVDVLSPAEKITSLSMLDVKHYGVIVTSGMRRGLLLPNLEGVDTVDEQIHIALEKAGISPNEEYQLERFKVVRHK